MITSNARLVHMHTRVPVHGTYVKVKINSVIAIFLTKSFFRMKSFRFTVKITSAVFLQH